MMGCNSEKSHGALTTPPRWPRSDAGKAETSAHRRSGWRTVRKGPHAGEVHGEEDDPGKQSWQQVFECAQGPVRAVPQANVLPAAREPVGRGWTHQSGSICWGEHPMVLAFSLAYSIVMRYTNMLPPDGAGDQRIRRPILERNLEKLWRG